MAEKATGIFRGVIDQNKINLQNQVDELNELMPLMEEQSKLIAQMKKKAYDQYIDAGFSPEQALDLCKQ